MAGQVAGHLSGPLRDPTPGFRIDSVSLTGTCCCLLAKNLEFIFWKSFPMGADRFALPANQWGPGVQGAERKCSAGARG